jgi:hypothetical protein
MTILACSVQPKEVHATSSNTVASTRTHVNSAEQQTKEVHMTSSNTIASTRTNVSSVQLNEGKHGNLLWLRVSLEQPMHPF